MTQFIECCNLVIYASSDDGLIDHFYCEVQDKEIHSCSIKCKIHQFFIKRWNR